MKLPKLRLPRFLRWRAGSRNTGSLTRRMIGVSALWIVLLLGLGGYALDRFLVSAITTNFDAQLENVLTGMISSAEIGPDGEVFFTRNAVADQRFLEPYSGLYYQVSGAGAEPFPSRSLWDRQLRVGSAHQDDNVHTYDSAEFPGETLRVVERDVRLPNSQVRWRFQAAQSRDSLDAQSGVLRRTMVRSFGSLGLGLMVRAALSPGQLERNAAQLVYAASKNLVDQNTVLAVQIDTVGGDVTALQGTVTTIEGQVAANTAAIADHETRITALEP